MSYVKLEFPVLVQNVEQNDQAHYRLKPLFVPSPIVIHQRFDPAISKLQHMLATVFKGFEIDRANVDTLLWYLFNPSVHFYSKRFQFSIGRQFFDGKISVAEFVLKGITFICLPAFEHFIFVARPVLTDKTSIESQIVDVASKWLKQRRSELQEDLDLTNYYATKGEFITIVAQNIRIKQGKFHFEKETSPLFFDSFAPDNDFDGGIEIEKTGTDLGRKYPDQLLRAFYREDLVQRLSAIIYQTENTPVALVGNQGVGKHSLIHEVVYRHRKANRKKSIEKLETIWHLDPTRIIAGMSIVGMWQKRFEAILAFAQNRQKDISKHYSPDKILFDNVVALQRIGKSAQNNMTLSDVLKPYLEKRKLPVILIATPEEWKIVQEKDRRFSDLFQVLRIPEVDKETAVKIVLEQRKQLELAYGGAISIKAIQGLFTIQRNYLKNKALPGSVMKLLRQLVTKYKYLPIDLPEVRNEFQDFSGLEKSIFDAAYRFEKQEVRKKINRELVGQPEAVDTLVNAVHTIKAKLTNPDRPMGSFMFIGPTGVGKTQAAKVLCDYLMGDEKRLMRFDMNEYIDDGAVHRLIGDYYNPEGQLTGKVRYNPFGILLLDEIEKAHSKVHDLLLQVLDDGRLTDSVGRTVDFTNTIIIMTSNIGAREVSSQVGFGQNVAADAAIYQKSMKDKFRPEFINRIDRIVIFKPLEVDHILKIARLQIKELLKRDGFVRRSTILNISQEALEWVAKRGYDARMGGRALKRQIERDLTALSAEQLVSTYSDRPILFDIYYEKGRLVPRIMPLEFTDSIEGDWLPKTPDEKQGKRFYKQLLRKVEHIEREINRLETKEEAEELIVVGNTKGEQLNWQHYDFKNKIAEVKDRLKTMILGYRDRTFDEAPAIPLRLKRIKYSAFDYRKETADKAYRRMVKDQLFQEEGLLEINEYYRHAAAQFDSLSTEFIDNFLNVFLLQLAARSFQKQITDIIVLCLETGIVGLGDTQIDYLFEHYRGVFEMLDIKIVEDRKTRTITAEGYALYDLFKGEEGIHLFYSVQQTIIPIKLIIRKQAEEKIAQRLLKVVRVYNKADTLTDVRTNFSNAIRITPSEFKLLLFAGVEKRLREELG